MNIRNITLTFAILFASYATATFVPNSTDATTVANQASKPISTKAANIVQVHQTNTVDQEQKRISEFVYIVQSRLGREYADRVAKAIVTSARRNGLPPMIVATTGYIESEFRMVSRPAIGIMQILPSTARRVFGNSGLDPYKLEDNIEMGSRYLATHYRKYAGSYSRLRGNTTSRSGSTGSSASVPNLTPDQQVIVMRQTWGRYNGSGMNGAYQRKAMIVWNRVTKLTPDDWKKHVNTKGPLWKN